MPGPTAANTHRPMYGYGGTLTAWRAAPGNATEHFMAFKDRAPLDNAGLTLNVKLANQGFAIDGGATTQWTNGTGLQWQPELPTNGQALMRLSAEFLATIVEGLEVAETAALMSSIVLGFSNKTLDPEEKSLAYVPRKKFRHRVVSSSPLVPLSFARARARAVSSSPPLLLCPCPPLLPSSRACFCFCLCLCLCPPLVW